MFSLRSLVKGTKTTVIWSRHVSGAPKYLVDLKVDNEGIGVLTMQRPPVNSLNVELLTEMANALEEADKSKYKGIVLTSGHTLAAGCIFSILTEYRVMVDGPSIISLNETDLGIIAPTWIVEAMVHVMGRRQAEVALTASTKFTPQEALKTGLVDDIAINSEDAVEKCKEFIKKFDRVVPFARKKTKERIRKSIIDVWEQEYQPESLHEYIKDVTSPEKQKSLEIYLEIMKNNKNKKI